MQITGLLHESKIFIEVGTAGGNTFDTIHPTEHLEGGRCIVFLKKKTQTKQTTKRLLHKRRPSN